MLNSTAAIADPATILKSALLDRLGRNPRYSLRAFARDLGLSHNYLSQILGRSRAPSLRTALRLCTALNLDETAKASFLAGLASPENRAAKKGESASTTLLEMDRFRLVAEWYHGALVELIAMRGPETTASSLASALGIRLTEARNALSRLERLGILRQDAEGWLVTEANFFAPTIKPELAVQKFHSQLMQKAITLMEQRNREEDFRDRDITGITLAVDPNRIARAKAEIAAFRRRMRKLLEPGERSRVYHLAIQFFPLTETWNQQTKRRRT